MNREPRRRIAGAGMPEEGERQKKLFIALVPIDYFNTSM
jgi:hypothetical protein